VLQASGPWRPPSLDTWERRLGDPERLMTLRLAVGVHSRCSKSNNAANAADGSIYEPWGSEPRGDCEVVPASVTGTDVVPCKIAQRLSFCCLRGRRRSAAARAKLLGRRLPLPIKPPSGSREGTRALCLAHRCRVAAARRQASSS